MFLTIFPAKDNMFETHVKFVNGTKCHVCRRPDFACSLIFIYLFILHYMKKRIERIRQT